jgi:putative peptide maturation system protein
MTQSEFDSTVGAAVALLRDLPRGVNARRAAQDAFERFREQHAAADPLLVVDHQPGARELDFDVLLRDPSGASLALALRPDGNPWAAHYADHWDAPWVVGAGDSYMSIQWAITSFHWMSRENPGYKARLEEDAIVCHRLESQRYVVTDDALQQAVDDFRHVHGLEDEAAMRAWLAEMGMTEDRFFSLVHGAVEARLVRDDVTQGRVEPYFAAHQASFDRTVVARVECGDDAAADAIVALARSRGLGALSASELAALPVRRLAVERVFARALPGPLRDAAPGATHVEGGRRPNVFQVLERIPARPDEETLFEARDAVFGEWVAAERERVGVRWFGV